MLADLASGARDAVIVYNLDRLHRRPAELEEFVALCEGAGVSQVATVTADIDLGNDDGLFMARIPNTSPAEAFLFNYDNPFESPNIGTDGITTAYGDLSLMDGDAYDTFAQLLGPEATLDSEIITDFTSIGQLVEGGIQDGTSIATIAAAAASPAEAIPPGDLPPTGEYSTPTDLPTVDVDVDTDTTATEYLTGIDNEAAIVTQSLANVNDTIQASNALDAYGINDQDEAEVAADLLSFQKEINGAINDFPSVTAYDSNSSLDLDLKELLTTELNINTWAINLDEQAVNGSATGLADVNADLITNATAEYDYAQDVLNFFSFEDSLLSIGL
jgi:hypothetical protein